MKVDRINKVNIEAQPKLKAFATVSTTDGIVLTSIKVMDGANGLFVSMPQQKGKDGEYHDVFFPNSKEARAEIQAIVLKAYEEA